MAIEAKRAVVRATEVHRNFGDLLKRVFSGREHLIIERDGLPVAVMLPVAEYEKFIQEHDEREKQERLKQFEKFAREFGEEVERRGITEEQMMELLEESKREVYEEFYGARKQR